MTSFKLIILVLFTTNILLLGLEASKPPPEENQNVISPATAPPGLPGIILLSEIAATEPGSLEHQCFTVGPFETRATAEAIVEMLWAHASLVTSRETEAFVDRGYWVFLPPFADEQAARQVVNTLYKAGLDAGLIINGEFNNSVSLGYFISQSNARNHRDRLREMGFEAEFRIQRADEPRYWVDYQQQTGVEFASRLLTGLVPAELHRSTACPKAEVLQQPDPASG